MDFLDRSSRVVLPVGGAASGFIGKWIAAVRWSFFADVPPNDFDSSTPKPDNFRQGGTGYWCYYADSAAALTASRSLGNKFPPNQVWVFEAPIDTVLLPETAKTNFGPSISMECGVRTHQSKKYRHEFQLIALPAAVAAYAQFKGYINYEFDLSEISDRDLAVTDEFAAHYIGGEYHDLKLEQNVTIPYDECVLYQRRAKLWADLGESDPRVYNPIGSGRLSTTSKKLDDCLAIANYDWTSPVWARVAMVLDPRMDALSKGSGNRLTRPALLHLYANEEDARADSNLTESTSQPTEVATPKPPLPSAWKGLENDWLTQLKALKAQVGSGPIPVVRAKLSEMDLANTIAATVDEVVAWWDFIGG